MTLTSLFKRLALVAAVPCLLAAGPAQSVTFQLSYDNSPDSMVDFNNLVGTGTFSYDGAPTAGDFLLSDLTNVSFEASFPGMSGTAMFAGPPFDPMDLSMIGISVFDLGGGDFGMVFLGSSAGTGGSLDVVTGTGTLSHEPEPLPGPGTLPMLYFANDATAGLDFFGDYVGRTSVSVSEPSALAMLGLGLAGAVVFRRRLAR